MRSAAASTAPPLPCWWHALKRSPAHVLSLLNAWGTRLDVPLRRDTKTERHAVREVLSAQQAGLTFRLDQLWGRSASL